MSGDDEPAVILAVDGRSDQIPWSNGKHLYDLWHAKKGNAKWPQRRDFQISDMRAYVAQIMIVDVERTDDALDFTVRLTGTGHRDFMPYDPTGTSICAMPNGDLVCTNLEQMLHARAPHIALNQPMLWTDYEYKRFDCLMLPLGEQEEISQLLLLVNYK